MSVVWQWHIQKILYFLRLPPNSAERLDHRDELITWCCRCGETWWGLPATVSAVAPCGPHRDPDAHTESLLCDHNDFSVFQLQPASEQHATHDNGKITALQCPTEVNNCANDCASHMQLNPTSKQQCARLLSTTCQFLTHLFSLPAPSTDPSWGRRETLLCIGPPMPILSLTQWVQYCRTEAMAAQRASCLTLTVLRVLCAFAQLTGTEMPCKDLDASPSTPTSGKALRLRIVIQPAPRHFYDIKHECT